MGRGFEMAITPVVFGGLGWLLDRAFGTGVILTIAFAVFGVVGIDMVAGPSEVLIIADGSTDPDWVAMDLFSQAEHDELAQAILVSPDAALLDAVAASAARLIEAMPRRAIIAASFAGRGAFIRVRDLGEACAVSNRIAPEHLELAVADPEALTAAVAHPSTPMFETSPTYQSSPPLKFGSRNKRSMFSLDCSDTSPMITIEKPHAGTSGTNGDNIHRSGRCRRRSGRGRSSRRESTPSHRPEPPGTEHFPASSGLEGPDHVAAGGLGKLEQGE